MPENSRQQPATDPFRRANLVRAASSQQPLQPANSHRLQRTRSATSSTTLVVVASPIAFHVQPLAHTTHTDRGRGNRVDRGTTTVARPLTSSHRTRLLAAIAMILFKSPRFTRLYCTFFLLVVLVLTLVGSRIDPARKRTGGALRVVADRVAQLSSRPWSRVGAGDTAEEAHRRAWELARATQYAGTGARVQRFLEKALRGEPFTVAAIGGSGASCSAERGGRDELTTHHSVKRPRPHAAEERPARARRRDPRRDDAVLARKSPLSRVRLAERDLPASRQPVRQRRPGGRWCGVLCLVFQYVSAGWFPSQRANAGAEEHIPTDVDLVLVELGINDLNHLRVIAKYELLVRSVLELDSAPAIINIE